ncbi:hypothetical protein BGX30_005980, partial [Mortierella sp. GBA39]
DPTIEEPQRMHIQSTWNWLDVNNPIYADLGPLLIDPVVIGALSMQDPDKRLATTERQQVYSESVIQLQGQGPRAGDESLEDLVAGVDVSTGCEVKYTNPAIMMEDQLRMMSLSDYARVVDNKVLYRRGEGDVMVNPYCPDLTRFRRSNTDFHFNVGPSAHLYISKYISKSENKAEGSLKESGSREDATRRPALPPPYNIDDSDEDNVDDRAPAEVEPESADEQNADPVIDTAGNNADQDVNNADQDVNIADQD